MRKFTPFLAMLLVSLLLGSVSFTPAAGQPSAGIISPADTPTDTTTPSSPTITPTDCPNIYVDIDGNTFYYAIHYLACRQIPRGIDTTHYGPAGIATRAQFAKMVVLGLGIAPYTPSGSPDFTDVQPSFFAFAFIEAGFHAGILSGYDPATCTANDQTYPCYLPNLAITRGQAVKLIVIGKGWPLVTPATPTPDCQPPYPALCVYIETARQHGVD